MNADRLFYCCAVLWLMTTKSSVCHVYYRNVSTWRTEVYDFSPSNLANFCKQTLYYLNNYNPSWKILQQLNDDKKICDGLNQPDNELEEHITFPDPIIKLKGILEYSAESKNREGDILVLDINSRVEHCIATYELIVSYENQWNILDQLYLDFAVCIVHDLVQYLPTPINITVDDCMHLFRLDRVRPAHHFNPIHLNLPYQFKQVYVRKELVTTSEDFLNQFWNQVLWYYRNYEEEWGIREQIEADIRHACWEIKKRRNFPLRRTFISHSPPSIYLRGELIRTNTGSNHRETELAQMPTTALVKHCAEIDYLLTNYRKSWNIWEQLIYDAQYCNRAFRQKKFYKNFYNVSSVFLKDYSELLGLNFHDLFAYCKILGSYIQEGWKMPTHVILANHIRLCVATLRSRVKCTADKTMENLKLNYESETLRSGTVSLEWNELRFKTPWQALEFCNNIVTLFLNSVISEFEDQIYLKSLMMCLNVFPAASDERWTRPSIITSTDSFYKSLKINQSLLVAENTLACSERESIVLTHLFPESTLGVFYGYNYKLSKEQFTKDFNSSLIWRSIWKRRFYFTDECNDEQIESKSIPETYCQILGQQQGNYYRYCQEMINTVLDNTTHHLEEEDLQFCLINTFCESYECTNLAHYFSSLNNLDFITTNNRHSLNRYRNCILAVLETIEGSLPLNLNLLRNCLQHMHNTVTDIRAAKLKARTESDEATPNHLPDVLIRIITFTASVLDIGRQAASSIVNAGVEITLQQTRDIFSTPQLPTQENDDVPNRDTTPSFHPLPPLSPILPTEATITLPVTSTESWHNSKGEGAVVVGVVGVVVGGIAAGVAEVGGGTGAGTAAGAGAVAGGAAAGNSGANSNSNSQPKREKKKDTKSSTTPRSSTTTKTSTTSTSTTTQSSTTSSTTESTTSTTTEAPYVCFLEIKANTTKTNSTSDEKKEKRKSKSNTRPKHRGRPRRHNFKKFDTSLYPTLPLSNGNCRLNINELNTMHTRKSTKEFIEITKNCIGTGREGVIPMERDLKHYLLLVLDGKTNSIVFTSKITKNFLQEKQNQNWKSEIFFVVGDASLGQQTSLTFDNDQVQYSSTDRNNVLPDGSDHANLVLLVYIKRYSNDIISLLSLKRNPSTGKYMPKVLTYDIIEKLKAYKQDCLLYASSASKTICSSFNEICPELQRINPEGYVLRDWEDTERSTYSETSISRCVSHAFPFDSYGFWVTPPSPGKKNRCSDGVPFSLEKEAPKISPLATTDQIPSTSTSESCTADPLLGESIAQTSVEIFKRGIKRKRDALDRDCMNGYNPNSRIAKYLKSMVEFDEFAKGQSTANNFWWQQGCSVIDKTIIRTYMSKLVDISVCENPQTGFWLEAVYRKTDKAYHFRCRICHALISHGDVSKRPRSTLITQIMTPEGVLDTTDNARKRNTDNIFAHAKSRTHLDSLDYVMDITLNREYNRLEDVTRSLVPPRERMTRPTELLFAMAMFLVQMTYPSQHFQKFHKFQKQIFKSDIGNLHKTGKGHAMIVQSVSRDYLEDLCRLINKKHPLTITLDAYQGVNGVSILGAYVMLVINGVPTLKFLCLLPLAADHSSQALFDELVEFIKNTPIPIEDSFKSSLVAFTGDGCSVNSGSKNSIWTKLRAYTGRNIPFFHCSSHRLQLVVTAFFKDKSFTYLKEIADTVDTVYSIFNSRSNRHAKLMVKQKVLGKKPLTPHKPEKIRWAESIRRGLVRLDRLYDVIVLMLKDIISEKGDGQVKSKCKKLLDQITSVDYVTGLLFLEDILDVFAHFSKLTQTRGSGIVDQTQIRDNIFVSLERLKVSNGKFSTEALNYLKCSGTEPCTLSEFEKRGSHYKTVKLTSSVANNALSSYRHAVIDKLLQFLRKYFPQEQQDMFSILDPSKFKIPLNVGQAYVLNNVNPILSYSYEVENFKKLLAHLGYVNPIMLVSSWNKLVGAIVVDPTFPAQRELKPSTFWLAALDSKTLPWTKELQHIIRSCLTIPHSSASVEQLFSKVTASLTPRRSSLKIQKLSDIMRIKEELPEDLSEWNAYEHVIKWRNRGHYLSDELAEEEDLDEEDTDENLYSENEDDFSRIIEDNLDINLNF